ncbi:MAG TPA: type II toxin-antitoxin system RelE/ParE family toxin [Sporichthyaceae bacterium]|jgi:mRNA-degrading endonuclease RelE of RelBE toxin-antitoxin system|nr:type II toxin-antitoxin system RelE/ParE family toxin [Sporichthyaceae bacterium]
MSVPPGEVRVAARAERDLDGMPKQVAAACLQFVFGSLAENPFRLGGPLGGCLAELRSARRGAYRVLYRIDEQAGRIEIVHVDHRAASAC